MTEYLAFSGTATLSALNNGQLRLTVDIDPALTTEENVFIAGVLVRKALQRKLDRDAKILEALR